MPTLLSLILPLYWVRLQCRVWFTNHNHDTTHLCPVRALFNCFLTYMGCSVHQTKLNWPALNFWKCYVFAGSDKRDVTNAHSCTYLLSDILDIKPALMIYLKARSSMGANRTETNFWQKSEKFSLDAYCTKKKKKLYLGIRNTLLGVIFQKLATLKAYISIHGAWIWEYF